MTAVRPKEKTVVLTVRLTGLALALAVSLFIGPLTPPARAQSGDKSGKVIILAINDVYRVEGIDDGRDGGMPRVRALRAELERNAPDLLFLHAGDFLSPSFLGRTYFGAQMVDLMNAMDGDLAAGSHDPRMFVAFGNHEFDDTHCGKDGPLQSLVSASQFTWLASNFDFSGCEMLKALDGNPNIARSRIVESGGLKIGLYGLTLARSKYAAVVTDPIRESCKQVAALRAKRVDAVVALTHLPWRTDLELLGLAPGGKAILAEERVCAETPDIVVGGHDHHHLAMPVKAPRLFKADADALTAWVIELKKDADGTVQARGRLVRLDESRPRDPVAQRLAELWLARHDERFCMKDCLGKSGEALKQCLAAVAEGACLKEPIARTDSEIETEEYANRSKETGFGDWVADIMRKTGSAQVAFLNAGAIRLNYNLMADTVITRRHLEQMFPFKNKIVVRTVPGRALWRAMQRAVRKRGEGGWAHFSGLALRLSDEGGKQHLEQMLVRKADGGVMEIGPDSAQDVKIVSLSFTLANGDKHGFRLCPADTDVWACKGRLEADPRWPLEGEASDLAGFVRLKLSELRTEGGLRLAVDKRLCEPRQTGCLIDKWMGEE